MLFTIIVFIFTLLVLVISHELGHFLAAKKFGIKILEFGFGLPPKIFGKKIGETLFSLNALPIGGFVKLFGEDETDKEVLKNTRSFASKPVFQRIVVVVAGVVMNISLAVILFWIVLFARGFEESIPLLVPHQFVGVNQVNESVILIGGVSPGSPAEQVGIKGGDRVIEVGGVKLENSDQFVEFTKQRSGEKLTLTLVDPTEKIRRVEVVPRVNPPEGQGPLGVEIGTVSIAHLKYETFMQKIASGVVHSYNLTTYSFDILGKLIATSLAMRNLEPVSQSVAGPVGITNLTNSILQTESPLIPYLNFVALLSLNLAIINILPFPALDGGRIFFLLIEAVTRRKVKPEVERWVHTVGMAILIALIVVVTLSDIGKLLP